MSFSIFTKRSREISTRLRLLGTGFQLSGVATLTLIAIWAFVIPLAKQPVTVYRWMFAPGLLYGALTGASMILIGRALHKRQRWGAYLAGFTLGAPLLQQLFAPDKAILSLSGIIVSTAALLATVTAWDELKSVRDSDLDNGEDEDAPEFPQRNRGYGEARLLNDPRPDGFSPDESASNVRQKIER